MADHLSALELDVAVTGGALAPERAVHLTQCADCQQKLERERTTADAVRQRPEFAATLNKLAARPETAAKVISLRKRAPVLIAVALAAAAGLVLVLNPPREDESRLKGAASVELINDANHSVNAARVGDGLQLALGAAGRPYAIVLGVDDRGAIDVVWPLGGRRSGPAPKGARTVVTRFEVTAGSVTLVALFSDRPLELADASRALAGALREGQLPSPLELPGLLTATTRLEVSR